MKFGTRPRLARDRSRAGSPPAASRRPAPAPARASRGSGTTRSPTWTAGVRARNPGGRAGSPRSAARLTRCALARSQTAAIVSEGFTPREVGITDESRQNRPSLPKASQRSFTAPSSAESAIRQPPERMRGIGAPRLGEFEEPGEATPLAHLRHRAVGQLAHPQ